jgi:hypothetical protein
MLAESTSEKSQITVKSGPVNSFRAILGKITYFAEPEVHAIRRRTAAPIITILPTSNVGSN